MSDIVERLRANMDKYPGFENMNTEAATEIERLRELVAFNEDQRRMLFDAATTLEAERDRWKAVAELWRAADHYGKLIQATPCADGGRYLASARAANGGEA